jgi:predicted enzyme related to lactoylglutathione lyase
VAVFEAILEQTYAGQSIVNRWNYIGTGVPASVSLSFALAQALGAIYDEVAVPPAYPAAGLMRKIAAIQAQGVVFDALTVKDVYSATDFYSTLFTPALTGDVGGEANSPAMAFGFFTNRIRTDVRRATKRFTGVPESASVNLGLINSSITAAMQAVATAMSAVLTYDDEGNTLTFTPAVCGKERYDPDSGLADPEGRAYRYFPTEAAQMLKTAQGVLWDYYPQVRTQTSRQYGRGR